MSFDLKDPFTSLMLLTKSEALQKGKFKDFLQELMPVTARLLTASSASFWLYRQEKDSFESIQSYDAEQEELSVGKAFGSEDFPTFSSRLKRETLLFLENKVEDEELEDFATEYMLKNRLGSWASMQVWNDNRLFGVITVSWKSKKDFGEKDILVLTSGSAMVSQCYEALIRLKENFLHQNEVSVLKVEEKEKEKLARKLSDHAFYTSHSIRHPLSTILALIDLIKLNWESREAYEELLQQLKIETMNLDETIRVMTAKIELD